MTATIILNTKTLSVIGVVSSIKGMDMTDKLAVTSAADLESLSNSQLCAIYNAATGKSVKAFSDAKAKTTVRTFAALEAIDVSTLTKLDAETTAKIKEAAASETGERKVRDSKLQRMAAALRKTKRNGQTRELTLQELMTECSKEGSVITEKLASQYISILRAPKDRFFMNIVKNAETGTYRFMDQAQRDLAASSEQAAA